MSKKKILILVIAICLYVGLFTYGMYNKYKSNNETTSNSTSIQAETRPTTIEITQDNFYDYFYIECNVANFSKSTNELTIVNSTTWWTDGKADLEVTIGQKVQGKINNVSVSIEALSNTDFWGTKYTLATFIPVGGVINKTIPVETSDSAPLDIMIKEPIFEINIVDVSGTITLEN